MKNVLKYIGIGLFLAIMAVINFKSCVGGVVCIKRGTCRYGV